MDISTFLISKPYPKYSQGLSIIEIMVALVISSILMAGVYTIFSNSKKTYLLQGEMAELNDNARFIMDEFKHVISKAGYAGCHEEMYTNPFQNSQNNIAIDGVSSSMGFPDSDILDINNFFQTIDVNAPNVVLDSNPITLDTNSLVPDEDDNIFIGSCQFLAPDPYTILTMTPAPNPWDNPKIDVGSLSHTYNPPYEIYMQNQLTYRVEAPSGVFSLVKCINDKCNPLIEGVQNMQIRYGIDTDLIPDSIPNQYVNADNISTNRVISIRITLLMRTINQRGIGNSGNPKTFNLDSSVSYNPHEDNKTNEKGYRHRLFTTTIFVRNSIYPL